MACPPKQKPPETAMGDTTAIDCLKGQIYKKKQTIVLCSAHIIRNNIMYLFECIMLKLALLNFSIPF